MLAKLGEGLYALTVTSAAGGTALMLLGKKGRFTGILRYFLSLVLVLMLVSPLTGVIRSAGAVLRAVEGDVLPEPMLYDVTAEYAGTLAEVELCRLLSRETGVPEDSMKISLTLDDGGEDGVVITSGTVVITDRRYRIGAGEVQRRMEELLSCPCDIRYRTDAEEP